MTGNHLVMTGNDLVMTGNHLVMTGNDLVMTGNDLVTARPPPMIIKSGSSALGSLTRPKPCIIFPRPICSERVL